jgi:hypothetical protein
MRPGCRTVARLLRVSGVGILGRRQRALAWFGFLALAAHAPVVAAVKPGDDWLLSVVVAAIVAFVIVIDDHERRRGAARAAETPPSD